MLEPILNALPPMIRELIASLPQQVLDDLEEIRVREKRPLEVMYRGVYRYVSVDGGLTEDVLSAYLPTREDCRILLDMLTNHSVYTLEEELKRGYITVRGGHRVGLCGKAILEDGSVRQLRDINSFNIRIAREVIGAAAELLPRLVEPGSFRISNTLIISPPQQGKTTLIRDLARLISTGGWNREGPPAPAYKVGIVDERSEIAGAIKGVPSFSVGPRTDVLDGCPKAEGMMMMIRGMSPDVVIVDEIGRPEDAVAIQEALRCGIRVIATAHGRHFEDIRNRPMMRGLIRHAVFSRYVVLGRTYGIGRVYRIYDESGKLADSLIVRGDGRDA